MLTSESKGLGIAVNLIHVGSLSGAGSLLAEGQWRTALICAFAASACILIVATAIGVSDLIRQRFSRPTHKKKPRRTIRGDAKKKPRRKKLTGRKSRR